MLLFGPEKTTKYSMELPVTTSTFQWIMNRKTYNGMSATQKKAIDDHCTTEWASKFAGPWIDYEAGRRPKLKAVPDREIYSITAAQTELWKKSAESSSSNGRTACARSASTPTTILRICDDRASPVQSRNVAAPDSPGESCRLDTDDGGDGFAVVDVQGETTCRKPPESRSVAATIGYPATGWTA